MRSPRNLPEPRRSIRTVHLHEGMPPLSDLRAEVDEMWDVLLGHVEPPIPAGVATLMEIAEAYHARVGYIAAGIQRAEADNVVGKGDAYYKFRTGELRTLQEVLKRSIDLGSRRITVAQMEASLVPGASYIPMARGAKGDKP